MYHGKVDICGVNTAKLKTLTAEEKTELLKKAHAGDTAAREALIDGNLRLVLSIVQRFASRGENMDDLFQVGCIGLIKAVDNFDIKLPVKFSTYAVPMIAGEVRRFLRDNNTIRVSRSLRDLAYRSMQAKEVLSRRMNREPTLSDIRKELETQGFSHTEEELAAALDAIAAPVSLFEPVYNDGNGDAIYLMDQLSDGNSDELWIEQITLKDALKRLEEREKKILQMRFFRGRTQMEIAEEIGISQAQVSRLEKAALEKLRKWM